MNCNKENSIRKAYYKLTDEQKQTLSLISILCTHIDGVSLSDLCTIIGTEPRVFEKEVIALAKADLLAIQVNTVFPPTEGVASFFDVSVDRLNICIKRLCQKTTLSIGDDLLQVRPYFLMAMSTMKYLAHSYDDEYEEYDDDFDYEEYGRLLVNITRHYEIYAEPDRSIHDVHDLPLWRRLDLIKSIIDDKSMLYAALCTCQANLLLNGFWYDESKQLLDEALTIAHEDNETLASVYFTKALWHENYGQIGDCLAWAYQSWEVATNNDEALKSVVAVYIAYQLALLEEFDTSEVWMSRIDIKKLPLFHIVKVFYELILALKYSANESLTENHLCRAECVINNINVNAPLKARLFYVRHQIYSKWGLNREACEQYREYANLLGVQYHSTEGAVCIYAAAEVDRLTAMGAVIAAKHVIHHTLDHIILSSPDLSLSVKINVCYSYVNFYLASEAYPLEDVYYNMGKEFIEETVPQGEDTISILRTIFGCEEIPASVSGDSILWLFEFLHLQTMMANRPQAEVKTQIELLTKRFPSHQDELQVIAGSLLNSYDAIHAWHMKIGTTEHSKRFEIALKCARIAVAQGLSWDGADFYNIVLNTGGYKALNKYQTIDILLEVAHTFEQCGERGKARLIWIQLEALAKGTSKLADVFQARGNTSYDHEQYLEALEYFNKCLTVVEPESALIDQRLSSLWTYKSSCYGALGEYQLAYESAVKAKQFFPLEEFDAFNLEFNHAFFAICVKQYEEARHIFTRAKKLARTEEERESVDEQLSILAMKKEEREAHLKQIIYNFDS